jgi:hypothetical protein
VYKFLFYLVIHNEAVSQSVPQGILNRGIFIIFERWEKKIISVFKHDEHLVSSPSFNRTEKKKEWLFFLQSKLASPACQVEFKHYFSNLFNIL